jgi:F-type H+-transporting ATPase subunit delta
MLKGAVARRYAEAIFELALKYNTVDATLQDIQEIATVFGNRKISYLLREPKIPARRKEEALRIALKGRVQNTSLNLALLLVQRDLVEYIANIASELDQLVLNYRNQAVANVTTAAQVDETQQATIQRALEARTGKNIIMQMHVDPSILGGVVARVGDTIIDGSVRYRLSVLEQQLITDASSTTTQFFTQEELDETARAIGSVDRTRSATCTQQGDHTANGYNAVSSIPAQPTQSTQTVPTIANTNTEDGVADLDQYNNVPGTKPSAYRS